MSANRRTTGTEPGTDCPLAIEFDTFMSIAHSEPYWRVQGHAAQPKGNRVVRYNRAVRIDVDTLQGNTVTATRLEWNRMLQEWVPMRDSKGEPVTMLLHWKDLDWVAPKLGGDPNGHWIKII